MIVLHRRFLGPRDRMASLFERFKAQKIQQAEEARIALERDFPCAEGATRDMTTLAIGQEYSITDPREPALEELSGTLTRIVPAHKVDPFNSSKTETGYYFTFNTRNGGHWFYPSQKKCYKYIIKRNNITKIYEQKTNQSGEPGTGPANIIAEMVGTKKSQYEEEKELEKLDDMRKKAELKLEKAKNDLERGILKYKSRMAGSQFKNFKEVREAKDVTLPAKVKEAKDEYDSIIAKLNAQAAKVEKMLKNAEGGSRKTRVLRKKKRSTRKRSTRKHRSRN